MKTRELFSDSGRLTLFLLRRERVISSLWILLVTLFSVVIAFGMGDMFDGPARRALAETLGNPAMVAMMGPVYGADNYTVGAMYSNTMLLWVALTVATMNIFLVVRHTRADEESGRLEVIRSLPVGRLANLASALTAAVIVNVVLGLLHGFGMALAGAEGMGLGGCMLYGAALCAIGLVFAAVTAVFCELCSSSGGAVGCSFAALGFFYLLRAAGDLNAEALSYISPFGLMLRMRIFTGNRFAPAVLLLAEAIIISAAAFALNIRRDIEQGLIPAKPGRTRGSQFLRSSLGLALRLLKKPLLIWLAVMFALGASYGSIMGDIENFVTESAFYQMVIGMSGDYSVPEMFTSMVIVMMALVCAIPVLTFALKPLSEETKKRAEHSLSRAVSRIRYMACYSAISFCAAVLYQAATAAGLYVSIAAVLETPVAFGFLMKANLVFIPALWVMSAIASLVTSVAPRAAGAVWAYYGYAFAMTFIGRMLNIPVWLKRLTPFYYVPELPAEEINIIAMAALTAIAAIITAVAFVFYKRRDMLTA